MHFDHPRLRAGSARAFPRSSAPTTGSLSGGVAAREAFRMTFGDLPRLINLKELASEQRKM